MTKYAEKAFHIANNYYKQKKQLDKDSHDYYTYLFYLINSLETLITNHEPQKAAAEIVRGMLVHLYYEIDANSLSHFFFEGGLNEMERTALYTKAFKSHVRDHQGAYTWRCQTMMDKHVTYSGEAIRKLYQESYLREMLHFAKAFQVLVIDEKSSINEDQRAALLCYLGLMSEASLQLRGDKAFDYELLKAHFAQYEYKDRIMSLGTDRNAIFHNKPELLPAATQLVTKEIYTMAIMQKYVELHLKLAPKESWIEYQQKSKPQTQKIPPSTQSIITSTTTTTTTISSPTAEPQVTAKPSKEELEAEQALEKEAVQAILAGVPKPSATSTNTTSTQPTPKKQKGLWLPSAEGKEEIKESSSDVSSKSAGSSEKPATDTAISSDAYKQYGHFGSSKTLEVRREKSSEKKEKQKAKKERKRERSKSPQR